MLRNKLQAIRAAMILLLSVALVVIVTWFAPSLSTASSNMLFRLRGAFNPPDDVVIVAIDDQSLQRIGQWPWPRSVMAAALDKLTQAGSRSVGLDVIYAEPSSHEEDRLLAAAIARNGRVVLPAQLYESASNENPASRTTSWLQPLSEFANSACGIGHAHASPDVDGVVRGIQLSKADDQSHRLWAFGLEVIRAAEQIAEGDVEEKPGLLRFGGYRITVIDEADASSPPGVTIVRQNEMLINFAGPVRSFRYYSIVDLVDGKITPSAFAGKLVLIGAVAESMGDTRVAPFMRYGTQRGQGAQGMPGVEIHANIINTIRSNLSFRSVPDWAAFAAAIIVILLSALTIRFFDGWRQVATLGLILLSVVAGSLFAFSRYLIVPPLAPMLTGFLAVIPLLLNQALTASRELDAKLAALVSSQKDFLSTDAHSIAQPNAQSIAQSTAQSGAQSNERSNAQIGAEFMNNELWLNLPRSLGWKLRAVDVLTTRLVSRMSFINRILSSMDEGVLVTDRAGSIVFANSKAERLLGSGQAELIGADFVGLLTESGVLDPIRLHQAARDAANGRSSQLEFEISPPEPRCYSLLLSALSAGGEAAPFPDLLPAGSVIGLVVLISDITKCVELDRMKTETLQLVSHELRTPLTSIQGLSDVLLKFPVAADESREMLRTIHSDAVRLGEMINRYLDLTRLESGAQPLHLAPVSCHHLIASCVRNLTLPAAERRINLRSLVDPNAPVLRADEQLLTQAVNNLLSNAIKYSPTETQVVVAAEFNHRDVLISVRDQGFGVPEEARERIFEKFYRLERDADSGVVGAGLGLPLVKEIVERHGGRITFESDASGSTFTIHLPLQPQALAVLGQVSD
ncbi:MAG TPA: CHASE2 domain-containing protein [Blastocatellia bacterium]|nr:CHASE2 domain-containing protein [Blastocatellia bacterium]